jgi:SAM-dependent methyltransferase
MPDESRSLWEASAAPWIANIGKDLNRRVLLDPLVCDLVSSLDAERVLDLGCGEGRSLRMFPSESSFRVGVDPTRTLIQQASEQDPAGSYVLGTAEALPFRDETFDLVMAILVLVDVEGFSEAIKEAARILQPGGHLLTVNLSSFMTTSTQGWVKDEKGEKLHVPVDDYFTVRPLILEWAGIRIINWHRPLEAYMGAYLEAGLRLVRFQEPQASSSQVQEHPTMDTERRVALFNVMLWQKE